MTIDKSSKSRRGPRSSDGRKKSGFDRKSDKSGRSDFRAGKPARGPKRPAKPASATARKDNEAFDLEKGERIAKVMARAGLCSRRDAEVWIANGRVELNGKLLETPAITVTREDRIIVDGEPLPMRERTRLWLYHKPRGLVTTNKDPEGRTTVFERLPEELPRVLAVGRLDINTEGLLLLTNDGGLARVLELPSTGWLRRYRVRAFGKVTQQELDTLADGVAIDGVLYGAIEATLDKEQGDNVWLTVGLREGKNREVKRVLEHLGLSVNRLIRLSFGPFQLMDLEDGGVREIRSRVLRDQLGETLIEEAGADFEAPLYEKAVEPEKSKQPGAARGNGKPQKNAQRSGWLSERDGESGTRDRWRKSGPGRQERDDKRGGGEQNNRRRNAGDRQEKVMPRHKGGDGFGGNRRFEQTEEERPRRFQRRIWSDDGLVEDKQQERRLARPKRDDKREGRQGDRPERGRGRPRRDGESS